MNSPNALAGALLAAQKAFAPVRKSCTNPHFRSTYADLATVLDTIVPTLQENGILLMQRCQRDERGVYLTTALLHPESGEQIEADVPLPDPTDWQKWGSALTYARRYTIMALLGVAPEDDDGNSAQGVSRQSARRAPPPSTTQWPTPDDVRAVRQATAQNAQPPHAPSAKLADEAAPPTGIAAAGHPDFGGDLDRAMRSVWTPGEVKVRGEEIARVLRDPSNGVEDLDCLWSQYADEIATMPGGAQKGLRKVYDGQRVALQP